MAEYQPWDGEHWHGKKVTFKLLGQTVTGEIVDSLHTVCAPYFLIAEFRDGSKQVKVGAPYQAFRLVEEEA